MKLLKFLSNEFGWKKSADQKNLRKLFQNIFRKTSGAVTFWNRLKMIPDFLDRVITGDESWVCWVGQSMEWHSSASWSMLIGFFFTEKCLILNINAHTAIATNEFLAGKTIPFATQLPYSLNFSPYDFFFSQGWKFTLL